MSDLIVGTTVVRLDEPCYGVEERIALSPDARGLRRYQIVKVIRGDQVVELRRDLGPAAAFHAQEFTIPGGIRECRPDGTTKRISIEHTVGELLDIADRLRAGLHPPPAIEPRDLIKDYYDEIEMRRMAAKRRSTFGGLVRVQRSDP